MSIASEVQRIKNAKANIRNSIINKGTDVPQNTSISNYAYYIDSIEAGGELPLNIDDWTEFDDSELSLKNYIIELPKIDFQGLENLDYAFYQWDCLQKIKELNTTGAKSMNNMFGNCFDLKEVPLFDMSNVTSATQMFYNCSSKLITIPQFNTSNLVNAESMFLFCNRLATLPLLDFGKVKNVNMAFMLCFDLTNIGGFKDYGKAFTEKTNSYTEYTLDFQFSTYISHDSMMNIINNLYDLNLTYGANLYRQDIQVPSAVYKRLSDAERQIAYNKGWNIVQV